jgi:hypothetical protein
MLHPCPFLRWGVKHISRLLSYVLPSSLLSIPTAGPMCCLLAIISSDSIFTTFSIYKELRVVQQGGQASREKYAHTSSTGAALCPHVADVRQTASWRSYVTNTPVHFGCDEKCKVTLPTETVILILFRFRITPTGNKVWVIDSWFV